VCKKCLVKVGEEANHKLAILLSDQCRVLLNVKRFEAVLESFCGVVWTMG